MLGLRSRVAVAFGLVSFTVSLIIAISAYVVARSYLVTQRESASLTRALLDARAVGADLTAGVGPGQALGAVPSVGESQAMARVAGVWYGGGVTVSPTDLPPSLLSSATESGAAQQRFAVAGAPFFGVAVSTPQSLYLEIFPLEALDSSLRTGGWFLAALSLAALAAGALVGRSMAARLMRPVASLGQGAVAIAAGDLTVRLPPTNDPDLEPLGIAFNDMADAVAARIHRERRFVANVSHELRSPVTTIVGTAELLDNHRANLDPRDAALVASLLSRSRTLAKTLLDLLELGSESAASPVQIDSVDVAVLTERLLSDRGRAGVLRGDRPVIGVDGRRLERILANLVDNAEHHGRGVVGVTIEQVPGDVLVHVDDSGPGVPTDLASSLFEPFVRSGSPSAADHDGAGLGLAIASECAAALGGAIDATTSPSGGARFTLRIPEVRS
jgi:signal transduction histidine kinase